MFDLITQSTNRPLRERSVPSKIVAIVMHVVVIVVVLGASFFVTEGLPPVQETIMAFVAAQPAAPPPPPPPPPAAPAATPRPVAQPARPSGQLAAPIEAPAEIQPERSTARADATEGVIGGIEGGVPGGVVGGIVGGIVSPAPPPPPPPPVARGPVRIGGQITAPALLHRVEPVYPDVAALAHLGGIVILEATVGTDGCVESVKVLRSRHQLLDKASEEALMQWRYSPLILNGVPTPFVLTVTFTFTVK
jgi:protein TonB